jgi:prephenate dehydrogenase
MSKFKTLSILGVGLIGGSIGTAAKQKKLAERIIGLTTKKTSLAKAIKLNAIDEGTLSLKKATEEADLVVVCTPVGTIPHIIKLIVPFVKSECVITDVGSTKKKIVNEIENSLPDDIHFVGGHPMAGSEKRGVEAATADLFENSVCILTKTKNTHRESLKKVRHFWRDLGAEVKTLTPDSHDKIIARVSHLPHLAAVGLIRQIKEKDINFISSGFRDTTRVAEAAPTIWRDICLTNREEILKSLDEYIETLKNLRKKIGDSNSKAIVSEFNKARNLRKKIKP